MLNRPNVQKICRICLGEENEDENPLITICKCSGSMKYIHTECLRDWVMTKRTVRTMSYSVIVIYKVTKCELCQ